MNKREQYVKLKSLLDEVLNEGGKSPYVSFDDKLVYKRLESAFVLLGDNNNSTVRGQLVQHVMNFLRKNSTLQQREI